MSLPNFKWIALFVQKLLGSQNFEAGGRVIRTQGRPVLQNWVTWPKPRLLWAVLSSVRWMGPSFIHLCTKFEADSRIHSTVKGVSKFLNRVTWTYSPVVETRPIHLGRNKMKQENFKEFYTWLLRYWWVEYLHPIYTHLHREILPFVTNLWRVYVWVRSEEHTSELQSR